MELVLALLTLGIGALASAEPDPTVQLPTLEEVSLPTLPSLSLPSLVTLTGTPSTFGLFSTPLIPLIAPTKPTATPNLGDSTAILASSLPNAAHGPNNRGNWASGFDINTDYTNKWPATGRTVKYTLRVQNKTLAPDGFPKQMLVINGQYPGPKIEASWGDRLEITVVNELTTNGTGIHWHGLRQWLTNVQDGANGVTECPIAPGDSKTYKFLATQYGTSWYHAHFSVQYGDGVLGPLIINGPASANYDIDLGPVLLTDRYAKTAFQEDFLSRKTGTPTAVNYLMNGQNISPDGKTGTRPKWTFQPGKKHRLRLINAAMDATWKIQIDGHRFQVIATDFVPIVPYYTNELAITIGQRYDVIVEANQPASNYWFRAMSANSCTFISNRGDGVANGFISYANAKSPDALPTTSNWPHSNDCVDEPAASLAPVVTKSVDSASFQKAVKPLPVNIQMVQSAAGVVFHWTIGGISQRIDWSNPTLLQASRDNNTYDTQKNVVKLEQRDTWTYWVIQNQFFVPHPMHLHGHDFNLLGQGNGVFDPVADFDKLNFKNPPRRDVAMLVAKGWTVIAFQTDNPGAWLMHCHIAWHAGEGLSLQFLERPNDIPANAGSEVNGPAWQQTCTNWRNYAKQAVWPQYDSGLRRRDAEGKSEIYASQELSRRGMKTRVARAEMHSRNMKPY